MPKKPPEADPKTCGSCEFYETVNPGDEAGYCYGEPPRWVELEGVAACPRPVVEPQERACRFYVRKLNS